MELRKWIQELVPHLDPEVKVSLKSSSEAGMVKKKKVTIKDGDIVKTKVSVSEA